MHYDLYADGSFADYNYDSKNIGMIGSWAFSLNKGFDQTIRTGEGRNGDSSRMELMAVIMGLAHAERGSHINIHCDALYVRDTLRRIAFERTEYDHMNPRRARHCPRRKILHKNRDVWRSIERLLKTRSHCFVKVRPDHTEVPEHQRMHELCTRTRRDYYKKLSSLHKTGV